MDTILTIVVAYIIGFIQLTVHELGHVVAAKKLKMTVVGFQIGVPIFLRIYSSVLIRIGFLPIKGFTNVQYDRNDYTKSGMALFFTLGLAFELVFMAAALFLSGNYAPAYVFHAVIVVALVAGASILFSLGDEHSDLRELFRMIRDKDYESNHTH